MLVEQLRKHADGIAKIYVDAVPWRGLAAVRRLRPARRSVARSSTRTIEQLREVSGEAMLAVLNWRSASGWTSPSPGHRPQRPRQQLRREAAED